MAGEQGVFYWNELMTRDPEKAKRFYAETLGWSFEAWGEDDGAYFIAMMGEKPVAGIFNMNNPEFEGIPEHWFSYICVDDVDKTSEMVTAAGGSLMRPVFDVPDVGRIAIVQDSNGAVVGMMTSSMDDG
ncbi:MAG: VOC family protein [Sedimenticola sp.]|nr:VOC family protein [Sedimenticola sp.]